MSDQAAAAQSAPKDNSRKAAFMRRLLSTVILWGVVAAALIIQTPIMYYIMMMGFGILGLAEFFLLLKLKAARWEASVTFCVSAFYLTATFWQAARGGGVDFGNLDALAFAAIIFGGFSVLLFFPIRPGASHVGIISSVFAFVYIPFLFNFIIRILYLPETFRPEGAWGYILFLLATTKFTDMGAYLVGSLIGKNKMIPHISPGKTWEGMIGAFGFAFLAAFGLRWLIPDEIPLLLDWKITALAAVLLALGAIIGDLAESTLKRSLETKDSGGGLPGIGGILDLIDSILFTAPILYFLLLWLTP